MGCTTSTEGSSPRDSEVGGGGYEKREDVRPLDSSKQTTHAAKKK